MPVMTLTRHSRTRKLKNCVQNNNKWAVHLSIKGGGCAGFSYDWGFMQIKQMITAGQR